MGQDIGGISKHMAAGLTRNAAVICAISVAAKV